jgi:hypothetical protein
VNGFLVNECIGWRQEDDKRKCGLRKYEGKADIGCTEDDRDPDGVCGLAANRYFGRVSQCKTLKGITSGLVLDTLIIGRHSSTVVKASSS